MIFIALLFALLPISQPGDDHHDFSGNWNTTYGRMMLSQDGSTVSGWYDYDGISRIYGTIDEHGLFVFLYEESDVSGEGWFRLSDEALSFSGQWRPDGETSWSSWEGYRSGETSGIWLVVLESEWQESLSDNEYSFGEMLEVWFSRMPEVEVRQRFIHDYDDVRYFCLEAAMLPGDVYLVFASHGTSDGLDLSGGTISPTRIVEAVSPMNNLALIHFSCCEIMAGGMPGSFIDVKRSWQPGFVVSGYDRSVDWGASAMIEFYYLNLMLEHGFTAHEAAQAVLSDIDFAGESSTEWMEAAGFKAVTP